MTDLENNEMTYLYLTMEEHTGEGFGSSIDGIQLNGIITAETDSGNSNTTPIPNGDNGIYGLVMVYSSPTADDNNGLSYSYCGGVPNSNFTMVPSCDVPSINMTDGRTLQYVTTI